MMSWPSADELWLFKNQQQNSTPAAPFSRDHKMQDKEHKQSPAAAQSTQQQQHIGSSWHKLQQHKAPAQSNTADFRILATAQSAPATCGAERPAWLTFLQGMLDAHQNHHLDDICISRANSSMKHSKSSSSSSSKQAQRKGHHGLAAPTAAVIAAAVTVAASDDSSAADNDATSAPHAATPHAAWPVCWPYI